MANPFEVVSKVAFHFNGHAFNKQMDLGCASYCPYAEQCLGSMPPELLAKKKELLVERVPIETAC
jgi:hypothetical protein